MRENFQSQDEHCFCSSSKPKDSTPLPMTARCRRHDARCQTPSGPDLHPDRIRVGQTAPTNSTAWSRGCSYHESFSPFFPLPPGCVSPFSIDLCSIHTSLIFAPRRRVVGSEPMASIASMWRRISIRISACRCACRAPGLETVQLIRPAPGTGRQR